MDCGSIRDGQLDVCVQFAKRGENRPKGDVVSIVRTDTCMYAILLESHGADSIIRTDGEGLVQVTGSGLGVSKEEREYRGEEQP